nr:PAS domain S-box protein [Acidocella aquatica]
MQLAANAGIRYVFAVLAILVAVVLQQTLDAHFSPLPPYIMFYPAVIIVAAIANSGPGLFTTLLSSVYAGYFILPPHGSFRIEHTGDIIGMLIFAVTGVMVSVLAGGFHRKRAREKKLSEQSLRRSEDHFRILGEGVKGYAIYMLDRDGTVVSWTAVAEQLKGWPEHEVLGKNFSLFFTAEAVDSGRPRQILEIARAEGSFHEEIERVRKDGSHFWAAITLTALRGEGAQPQGYAVLARDISERKQAERDIAASRSQLLSIVNSALDAIVAVDSAQRIVLFNPAAETMFGYSASDIIGQPIERLIPHRFHGVHAGHLRNFAAEGVASRNMEDLGTLSGRRSNGDEFPLEASISQGETEGGQLFTAILRDITQRRRAEAHQSLLLGELAHRVKNTLAVVQSIAAQTHRFSRPEDFYITFCGRLEALGNANDLLTSSEWEGATLADIITFSFAPYSVQGMVERWTTEGPRIWLAPNEAVTLSLVFHEMITNAVKFGALSDANGKIGINWKLTSEDAIPAVTIHWREYNGPAVNPPTRRGFGSKLLERAITHEFNGDMKNDFHSAGFECMVRLPLSAKVRVQT